MSVSGEFNPIFVALGSKNLFRIFLRAITLYKNPNRFKNVGGLSFLTTHATIPE